MRVVGPVVLAAAVLVGRNAFAAELGTAPKPSAAGPTKAKAATAAKPATAKPAKKAAAKPAANPPALVGETLSGPEVREFRAFCDTWMEKLRDRETFNTANIKWETHDGRVSGEYVGYAKDCTCIAREEPGKDPIGKITYRETRYRREGATQAEAQAAPGTIVEQSDVTEIFRFGKGRWLY